MVGRMADSVVDVLKEAGVEKRADRDRHRRHERDARRFQERGPPPVNAPGRRCRSARRIKTPDEIELPEDQLCRSATPRCGRSRTSGWSRASASRTSPRRSTSSSTRRAPTSSTTSSRASGGNTSPYRRWHTDKLIRQGDLVIVDINAVGPGGYFIDFVRCFLVDAKPKPPRSRASTGSATTRCTPHSPSLSPATRRPTSRHTSPSTTTTRYGTVSLQQFAHSIGLSLYEGTGFRAHIRSTIRPNSRRTCTSRSRRSPGTRASNSPSGSRKTCSSRPDGPVLFTLHPHDERMFA